MRAFRFVNLLILLACLAACADSRYYLQSVSGHLQMMQAARPLTQWLADDEVAPALKQRLELAQRIRKFAVAELGLPDNASYQRYADLQRRAVVWNVVAAPALSLKLKTWCFPVTGCVVYRGYFSEADARTQAQALRDEDLEVSVYGVPAYSTLGWLNWAGGDPLLNTFIHYPEGELARMIFHELAHQVLYVKDDSVFNESFATAVERLGGERWLAQRGGAAAQLEYATFDTRRRQLRALSGPTRARLSAIYAQADAPGADRSQLLGAKQQVMDDFRARYTVLKTAWGGYSGFDGWVANANNAALGAQAAYDEMVPGFEALFEREGRCWPQFYDAVRQLAHMPAPERARALKHLSGDFTRG